MIKSKAAHASAALASAATLTIAGLAGAATAYAGPPAPGCWQQGSGTALSWTCPGVPALGVLGPPAGGCVAYDADRHTWDCYDTDAATPAPPPPSLDPGCHAPMPIYLFTCHEPGALA
jgi:hypothetical protein